MTDILRNETIALCRNLIRIDTTNPPGNELAAAEFCQAILDKIGFETLIIPHSDRRASLLAILEGQPGSDTFLFIGHLDTVPPGDLSAWDVDPHSGCFDDEKIIGRGAADMKGGLTAILQAAGALKGKKVRNTIIIALTADEESGCLGANALIEIPQVRRSKLVLIPEPTSNQIGIAEKGALWARITARGKSAHGSMPDLGINAIDEIVALIDQLDFSSYAREQHDYLGSFTNSINTISGGIKTNIIPDRCEITLDMRTLPAQDHREILREIEISIQLLMEKNHQFHYQLETIIDKPGIETDCTQEHTACVIDVIKRHKKDSRMIGVNYYTDGAVLIPALGAPFLIFGPGDPGQAHSPNEYLKVKKLLHSREIYTQIMQKLAFA